MRAVVVEQFGGPEALKEGEREAPQAGPGDLVVDVAAAGVNFADVYARKGLPPYGGHVPFVAGSEGAGIVRQVGPEVTGVSEGDRVAWAGVPGSYAEQVVIPAASSVPVPEGVDLQVAAAVMLQGITAHYLCTSCYPVADGDVSVVHAAAGGVGLLLTQMVTMRGGVVVATTSTREKASLARKAGADHIAGYDDFGETVTDVSGGAGAAVVYDGVGQSTFDASLASLRSRGTMVLYGAASGPVPPFELQRLSSGGSLYITRPTMGSYIASRDELLDRTRDLFDWIGAGRLSVRIGATYPLAEASRAHADIEGRGTTGKLLLLPG